ncbi:MAG: glutamate-1-semialdehyde 2,1-aminomutase [Candidatus Eremiobacteraeota bacterium]|nr:glutamate-1-semialdehyde 2,1-aminomutase [Candidatus Eremiobacteraeota bacterium]
MKTESQRLFEAAQQVFPGGVNSPVRAFSAVGGTPRFLVRGEGSRVYDADGDAYIDYVGSWGPLICGHAHPEIVAAIQRAAADGTSFGATTPLETQLARRIMQALPSVERIRFVNSGTEACMSAVRLARAFTQRDMIVKCEGCYHGHADALLVDAGSGALSLGVPGSAGVSRATAELTLVVPYNDLDALRAVFAAHGERIACVILEPVAANMGLVMPKDGYLPAVAKIVRHNGALLIFDEVISGFRLGWGGAQTLFGVRPDLTCLGKVVGAGLPVGAFGGREDVMARLAPLGEVYQAGTLSGNPLAMAAGIAQLDILARPGTYEHLERMTAALSAGLSEAAAASGVAVQCDCVASVWGMFFNASPVLDLRTAKQSDTRAYARYFHAMLERGVYLAPSQFEVGFVSLAHSEADVRDTIAAARDSLAAMRDKAAQR